jgi:hypothetical protein
MGDLEGIALGEIAGAGSVVSLAVSPQTAANPY